METVLEKTPSISLERGKKKYKIKKKDHSQKYIWGTLFIFLAAFVYFVCFMCEYKWDQVRLDLVQKFVGQFFAITSVPLENWIKIFSTLLNTLLLSIVTTIVSIVIGLFLDYFPQEIYRIQFFARSYAGLQGLSEQFLRLFGYCYLYPVLD